MKKAIISGLTTLLIISTCLINVSASRYGSQKNPYPLNSRTAYTLKAKTTTWFTLTERGYLDFDLKTDHKVKVTIYKKNLLFKKKYDSFTTSNISKNYSIYNNARFIVSITTTSLTHCFVSFKQHKDTKRSSVKRGLYWEADAKSPIAREGIVVLGRYYIPSDRVAGVYAIAGNDKYLNILDKAIKYSTKASIAYCFAHLSFLTACKKAWAATKVSKSLIQTKQTLSALGLIGVYDALKDSIPKMNFSLVKMYQKEIKCKSGLNIDTTSKNCGTAKNGICIETYLFNGTLVYSVSPWTVNTVYGAPGYKGSFKNYNYWEEK